MRVTLSFQKICSQRWVFLKKIRLYNVQYDQTTLTYVHYSSFSMQVSMHDDTETVLYIYFVHEC